MSGGKNKEELENIKFNFAESEEVHLLDPGVCKIQKLVLGQNLDKNFTGWPFER